MKRFVSSTAGRVQQILAGVGVLTLALGTPSLRAFSPADWAPVRAAVFSDALPGFDQTLAREIGEQVKAAGYETTVIDTSVLTNAALLTARYYDLLVLPGARELPIAAGPAITSYLREGGDLLALGLPAWQTPLFRIQGQWISRQTYEQIISTQQVQHVVETFDQLDLRSWTRHVGDPSAKAEYELANAGQGKALHVKIGHLGGWETFKSPALPQPFPAGHRLTCFRAKGGPHTRQLALEWAEQDGSRWIATVDLTPEWKEYALLPDRFKAWPPPVAGGPRGHFHPERASTCCVGLALSHTALDGNEHEYWFDTLGTAPNPLGEEQPTEEPQVPVLESVSPSYQCYPITTPVVVREDDLQMPLGGRASSRAQVFLANEFNQGSRKRSPSQEMLGLNPRARGVGFAQGRAYRWEPLLGAYDAANGDYRGALGALVVNGEPPLRGSVWAVFTPADVGFYRQPVVTHALRQVLTRIQRGVFLSEGGSEFFTLFAGQEFKAGARVVNFGRTTFTNLQVAVSFANAKGAPGRSALEQTFTLAPGEAKAVSQDGLRRRKREDGLLVTLRGGGTVIDGLQHELGVWEPKTRPQYIEARDGGLWRRGKPWKVHGVNYMPSSGIGLANGHYFEAWVGHGAYDPAVIERDLRRVKAMNLNAVSVFIDHASLGSQHLLDLLRRCDRLGLQVNQSLRPGTPMEFPWRKIRELIEHYRLPKNDTVFAYDLAWEPSHGNHEQQEQAYTALWSRWVTNRYGSVAAAEKRWGVSAPRPKAGAEALSVPTMVQLTRDGEWRKLAADYRLFLDDVLRERYSAARQLVRSVDPHHAVSFRMSCAGDPTYNWENALPYDFYGLAHAVDVWEPEAYGRIGDWDRVRAGEFTAAYAQLCDPRKPLVWAEMGYTVWDMNRMAPDPDKLNYEARYYADFYRMLTESGADGVFFWWYPGGFRLGENSDFGIINPDGTDRPVTRVIRSEGERFLKARKPATPDYWITIDRDRDARGLYGIYEAVKDEFWQAIAAGRRPGLKWAQLPGEYK